MSAHSYVTCLVHRQPVPRERTVCVDDYERAPARRRHVCHDCIRALSLAQHEESRSLRIAAWRSAVRAAGLAATDGAGRG